MTLVLNRDPELEGRGDGIKVYATNKAHYLTKRYGNSQLE
jgi:hypothetical protein